MTSSQSLESLLVRIYDQVLFTLPYNSQVNGIWPDSCAKLSQFSRKVVSITVMEPAANKEASFSENPQENLKEQQKNLQEVLHMSL